MSDRTVVWEGRFLTAVTEGPWEYAERKRDIGAAVIVAVDADRHLLLVEQYRIPVGKVCLELPAGLVGDDSEGEAVTDAARRELEEETGYHAASVEEYGEFYSSPGMTSERFTIVVATGLTRIGDGGGEENEDITVRRVPLDDAPAFIAERRRGGLGIDAKLLLILGSGLLADL
ncbi:ADP-ribose pyrophosphatase [Sphingomonas jinjuensis]|uniref:GDP-mannose pyrophosphatase n=1 Tax=Sphingomonas jinjuensis TaxID=535907 RepID=A0A840F9S5_9SPHN|nr:NUDIX hydrolase [Sphingomonas jinjuensis]MBB4152524.1 ADP-ribose pyrophosphatase [Sphingomonas jinjuensis]